MARQHQISKTDAGQEINRFTEIVREAKGPDFIGQLPPGLKAYLNAGKFSFVFYKDQIDAMFAYGQGANALKIYFAAKPYDSAPSVVIVPCTVDADEKSASDAPPPPPGDGGGQYPLTF
jgi:hypothetical protein